MKLQSILLTVLIIGFINSNLQAQQGNTGRNNKLDSIFFKDIPKDAPGAAVAILMDGNVIYERYGGLSDLKKNQTIDENTRFNIASNGKQFTALAVLLLEEAEKLSLDDDIRKYLPTLFKEIKDSILVRHLLTHTSGIRDVYDLWSLKGLTWWEEKFSNKDAFDLLAMQTELNFKPGTEYLYSNSNYILLTEIVSATSGMDFVSFTDAMFKQLGMSNTSFVDNYKQIKSPIAKPYFNFDKWFNYNWTCNIHGDGNLFSPMKDQITWEKLLIDANSEYLSEETIRKLQILVPNFKNYGFGLEFGTYKGKEYRFHEGSTGAWKATTIRFNQPQLTIVTLSNSGKITTDRQTRNMADVLLFSGEANERIQLEPDTVGAFLDLPQIVGAYVSGNSVFQFEARNNELFLLRYGRNDTKLVRESDNVFHQWNDPAFKQEFIVNNDKSVTVTFYHTSHQPYSSIKEYSDWSSFDFTSIKGKYRNDETDIEFFLNPLINNKYELKIGKQKAEGILITPKKLFVDGYTLDLSSDDVFLNGNRIRQVRFEKIE